MFTLNGDRWTPDTRISRFDYPTGVLSLSHRTLVHQRKGFADCQPGDTGCCHPWYQVVIYRFDSGIGAWTEEYSSATRCDGWYGSSVAIHGDWAVFGLPYYGDQSSWIGTTVQLHFNEVSEEWSPVSAFGVSVGEGSRYGSALSMAENLAVVSAPGAGGGGTSYVFRLDSGSWALEQTLTASDRVEGDEFGSSVAIDGERIILGAAGVDDPVESSGAAYVFRHVVGGQIWSEEDELQSARSGAGDEFGKSVDISGDQAIIGVPNDRAVAVFRFDSANGEWREYQYLQFPSETDFGRSVAISGNWIVVGSGSNGSTYAFYSEL